MAILLALVVIYGALAVWLGRHSITVPIIFVAVGVVVGSRELVTAKSAELLTEMTRALLLFADASTLNLRQVRDDARLAGRLLTIRLIAGNPANETAIDQRLELGLMDTVLILIAPEWVLPSV